MYYETGYEVYPFLGDAACKKKYVRKVLCVNKFCISASSFWNTNGIFK